MLNRVILMGRLVSDPELKTTNSGLSVTSFRIAVDYFGKGSMIALEGQLQTRTYQAKDGTNRYVVEVVADNVSFTGERRDNNNNNGGYGQQQYGGNSYPSQQTYQAPAQQSYQQPQTSYQSGTNNDFQNMPLDDDLPF